MNYYITYRQLTDIIANLTIYVQQHDDQKVSDDNLVEVSNTMTPDIQIVFVNLLDALDYATLNDIGAQKPHQANYLVFDEDPNQIIEYGDLIDEIMDYGMPI